MIGSGLGSKLKFSLRRKPIPIGRTVPSDDGVLIWRCLLDLVRGHQTLKLGQLVEKPNCVEPIRAYDWTVIFFALRSTGSSAKCRDTHRRRPIIVLLEANPSLLLVHDRKPQTPRHLSGADVEALSQGDLSLPIPPPILSLFFIGGIQIQAVVDASAYLLSDGVFLHKALKLPGFLFFLYFRLPHHECARINLHHLVAVGIKHPGERELRKQKYEHEKPPCAPNLLSARNATTVLDINRRV